MSAKSGAAGGLGAISASLRHLAGSSVLRGGQALAQINQPDGFDCPGCAWPEAADRGRIEFCENGVKHVAHEVTRKRVTRELFREWPVAKLRDESDHWLESQGRLVEPMMRR